MELPIVLDVGCGLGGPARFSATRVPTRISIANDLWSLLQRRNCEFLPFMNGASFWKLAG